MAIPLGLIQAGVGGLQSLIGGLQAARAQKQLSRLKSPTYIQSASVGDLYNKALQRYSQNPYQSAYYQNAMQSAGRGLATGMKALGDRRSTIGGLSTLVQNYNDSGLRAVAGAEADSNAKFSQLSGAAGMKAGEERTAFQINKMLPYEQRYNLLASRASGGNQIMNAGMQNVFGGLQSQSQMDMISQMYGSGGGGGGLNLSASHNYVRSRMGQ